jgi:hypothetical protein
MADKNGPPSLLDRLRNQSSALRDEQTAQWRPVEESIKEIDRRLWRAFKWLDEALSHLEVIRPQVARDFSIPGVLSIASPRYERGFVSYRRKPIAGQDVLDHVEVFYRLLGERPIDLIVQPAAAQSTEDRLRSAQLQFDYRTEQDSARVVRSGHFIVKAIVTANVRFEPDYRNQIVQVTLRNVDRFESVSLDFRGDAVDEPMLEDMLRFILGESNTFLRRAPLAGMRRRPDALMA